MTTPFSSAPQPGGDTLYTLRNRQNMCVTISTRGAALISWLAPDRRGHSTDVLLGYPDAQQYRSNAAYFGAIVGRWANRIAGARFTLDGIDYQLEQNDGSNHLHGGRDGFHRAQWQGHAQGDGVRFTLTAPDGAGGYPGQLQVELCYRLDPEGRLSITYEATSDAPTPINLTAHPYFNLNGGSADIGDHVLQINAERYLQIDAEAIPVAIATVTGSPFDFRQPAPIATRLSSSDPQIILTGGFDHCFCVRPDARAGHLREVARVSDPASGRALSVATTEAGLQFYSGNYLAGVQGRGSQPYAKYAGFCLEAQAYPNQINGPDAEAVILRPGQVYRQTTVYQLLLQE